MWRTSAKISRSTCFSARKSSMLKQSFDSGRKIKKIVPHQNLSTNATEGKGGLGVGAIVVTTGIVGIVGGGFYYAKNNPTFRKTVEDKVPFTASLFDAAIGKAKLGANKNQSLLPSLPSSHIKESADDELFRPEADSEPAEENSGQGDSEDVFGKKLKGTTKSDALASVSSVDQIAVSSVDLDISKTVEKEVLEAEDEVSKTESEVVKVKKSGKKKKSKKEKKEKLEDKEIAEDEKTKVTTKDAATKETEVSENSEVAQTTALEISLQTAVAAAMQLGEEARQSQEQAINAVRAHRDCIHEAIYQSDNFSKDHWERIGNLLQSKTKALNEAETMATKLSDIVEKVYVIIAEGKEKGMETSSNIASETLAKLTYNVQQARNRLIETQKEGTVLKQYQEYVEEGKQHLKEQLASINSHFPDSEVEDKSDVALLAYAQNRIKVLEDGLDQRDVQQEKLVRDALQKQQKEQEKLAEMRLKHELESLKTELTNLMKQREATMIEEQENDLRQQLRRQAAVFGDHLSDVLKVQADELNEKHQSEKREGLLLQRQEFDLKIRGTLARLNGILKAVQNRADIERAHFQAQELWLACQSLSTAITGLGDDRPRLYPIHAEVERIRRVTNHDKVISSVLDSLPEAVLRRGLFTEDSLRRRFPIVKKVCKQVAMVGEDAGGVWSYFLSYLQSLLMFDLRDVKHPVSVEPEKLDTYVILSLATKSLEEGDTEQAVKYMNQLRGEPMRIAKDWIEEARLFLETRQVAKFLTVLASAYNIGAKK